jgi:G3E family GTPase
MDAPVPHDPDIGCVIVRRDQPLPALALTLFLEALADHVGADLLRLKGLIHVAEHPSQPAVIHGVQHVFHEPSWLDRWPSDDRSTRLVLIGRGLSRLWVEQVLDALAAEVMEVGQAGGG